MFRYLAIASLIQFLFSNLMGQPSLNVQLVGQYNRGDTRYSGSWAYIAQDGKEYALLGAKTGTVAYCITESCSIEEKGFVSGPETNWREITVIGHHAFVTTDVSGTGHGMQVIDLSFLPDSLHLITNYTTTFTKGHIIQKAIDSDEPYVYVMGTTATQGVHILDVSSPSAPKEVGLYAPGYYIHDAHIRDNLLFAAAFYETKFDIVDISDKTNPQLLSTIVYDGKSSHSASSTADGRFLITADEQDGYPARIFNIEDLSNPFEVARYTANEASLVHNPYVYGNYCFISHNTEGFRVLDIADPTVPVEVGFYDTWPGESGGFNGLWSACPYFPSGKIIGGNRTDGLYVWEFNGTKAGRIYGIVKDSLTNEVILNALVELPSLGDTLNTGLTGFFKKGMLEGEYQLTVKKDGFFSKSLNFDVAQGDSLYFEIPLVPVGFSNTAIVLKNSALIEVSPNPSAFGFDVDLKHIRHASTYEVMDAMGRFVISDRVPFSGAFHVEMPASSSGIMWLAIFDSKRTLIAIARLAAY
ncbi:MAG: choice-of-anchor B family protein [Saprospiraceae bacterium]|nr:choice-of-anchor B family protein [Saprospiraceae bacterium]